MKHPSPGASADWRQGGFALYVHWPFCQSKCPYCDFNSHVAGSIDQTAWAAALARQIAEWAEIVPDRVLSSIFFGGGTPSLMDAATVESVIEAARSGWTFANDIEVTLEANPTSVEVGRFRAYAEAGVNRVSLGVQALDDDSLRKLGRKHTVEEALAALEIARSTFDRVSFDLIYARQDQSLSQWETELRRALDLGPSHLSLYQLTIEEGTAFGDRYKRGKLRGLPDEDLGADLFEVTQALCAEAGLGAYEVSNHCRPGQESRHNLVYWRYGDYVGVGPGAHGRVTLGEKKLATVTARMPDEWLARSGERGAVLEGAQVLSAADQATEYLLMSLRLTEGTDLIRLESMGGGAPSDAVIRTLCAEGLIWQSAGRIGATAKGRPLLNGILRELL